MSMPALARTCVTATGCSNRAKAVVANEPPACSQDGQGERQVQPRPGLAQVSRGEVDGQALLAPGDAAGAQRGPDTLARLAHGGVGQAHEGESGQALGGVSLDLNDVSGQPGQRDSERAS